ncbi:MAG: glycosyltransferase [Terracoccus sp.]
MSRAFAVVGPDRHGVVTHALALADASPDLRAHLVRVPASPLGAAPTGLVDDLAAHDAVMLNVTDRIFGSSPAEAADILSELAARTRLAVSLHDLPQPGEGHDRHERRRAAYGRIACSADLLIVASGYERELLLRCVSDVDRPSVAPRVHVLPLPVGPRHDDAPPAPASNPGRVTDLAVLGFLYPGKGVEEVVDAAAILRAHGHEVGVTNYGGVADGHDDVVARLEERAARVGVPFRVTGYLGDAELAVALHATGVPVAAHRHVSASGSINSWLTAGRRPVAVRGPYVTELSRRLPGSVVVADDLVESLSVALQTPASTWLDPSVVLGPTAPDSAAEHLRLLESLESLDVREATA